MERCDICSRGIATTSQEPADGVGYWDSASHRIVSPPEPGFFVCGAARGYERQRSSRRLRGLAVVRAGDRGNFCGIDGALADVDGERDGDHRPARILRD